MTINSDNLGASPVYLTNEALFKDWEYNAERPGAVRWSEEGATYTALETAAGYEDAVLEKDQYGDDIKIYQEVVRYDPASGARETLISLQQLTPKGRDTALVVDDYRWSDNGALMLIYTNAEYVWREKSRGDYWVLNRDDGDLWQLGGDHAGDSQMMFGKFSPDANQFAYVWKNNIYLQDLSTRSITALTMDASDTVINGLFDWAYEEEFSIRDGFRWSPDSRRIAYWQLDTHAARDFFIINNTDTLYPTVEAIPYPKVGQENAAARIGVVAIDTASGDPQTLWIKLPGVPKDMYVPRMDWADNSEQLLIQQLNRKQSINTVFCADASNGQVETVLIETEETFLDLLENPRWLKDSQTFIWQSERDGWKHIYRVSRDGQSVIDLTPGEFDVTELVSVDEVNGWLYFIASPHNVSQRYLQRTYLDGNGQMEQITPTEFAGSNHYQIAADSSWAIHTHSSFLQPPVHNLISLPDHTVHRVIEDNADLRAKIANLKLGELEFYSVEARDGLRLDGYMLRPPNMDATKKYPLINYVYGEPAGQTVRDIWQGSLTMWHILMSQRGFIISSVDSRGTAAPRGHDWRRSVYGAVGIVAARDQCDSLQAICERWNYIDSSRVGVWGHSGGGSMTLNLLFRYPQQYHVGVSMAPVPDQRLYDSIYQERYSGLLEEFEDNYREASPITHAANLQGKLLLIHGTGDDNVHYQGSELLVDELIKHNRQFDFMAYPNRRHGIVEGEGTSLHLRTLQSRYFEDHL
ncbi:S9 family peptidase [Marinobacter alexandrii]|uniref:S9 family peptidase n=1 Tax=Marinobacter alexandrii TaxID=2570351 RepID=UPI00329811BC